MKVIAIRELDSIYGTEEELSELSDVELVLLAHEDISYFFEKATFEVIR